jgi:putative FmdB family regulatory protein
MPIYDYRCEPCDFTQEVIHLMSEEPKITCAKGHPMVRLLGIPSVHFKGYFPGKRIKEVDARKRRQERRVDAMVKAGKMTKQDVRKMIAIRDKYRKGSPYYDPAKTKSPTGKADPTKGFDDGVEHRA